MQNDIVTIYVIYLFFDIFEIGFYLSDKEFENRLRLYPFYDYIARY
jgi:hypothetical protein